MPELVAADSAYTACVPKPVISDGPFSFGIYAFFDAHTAVLTSPARHILDEVKKYAADTGMSAIVIEGHTDASEQGKSDRGLDLRRAAAVRDYVQGSPFARSKIFLAAYGDKAPLVTTTKGPDPQNRFIQIVPIGYTRLERIEKRKLVCRKWLLANCIGTPNPASSAQCRAAVDFLVRGDATDIDLDWHSRFSN